MWRVFIERTHQKSRKSHRCWGWTKTEPLSEIKENLLELEELVCAAGGEIIGSLIQVLPQWNSATLIGSGKVDELAQMVQETGAQLIVMDHQLTGIQTRNLEVATKARVIDRNQLILDIFALRAQTFEGKLQVELAQLLDQYAPHGRCLDGFTVPTRGRN